MKKAGIITMTGDKNYGNKLQNYALHNIISNMGLEVYTLWNKQNFLHKSLSKIKRIIIILLPIDIIKKKQIYQRENIFKKFDKKHLKRLYIKRKKINKINKKISNFVIGSDQIWNPNVIDVYFGLSIFKTKANILSYAASLGVSTVDEKYKEKIKKELTIDKIKHISVREECGKNIIEKITKRKDIKVLIDPTMLLNAYDWEKVSQKPKMLKSKKYILNYFLGELSKERKKEIERIAEENDCQIINILDKNNPFYMTGPSEFLYLEKHAFLICTDSFHSSVFAIIYDRPFIIFEREDKKEKMNSRLDTLINKFNLKDRKFNGKSITKANLNHDYTEAYKILEKEREKALKFLKKALDINE